jgi:hypothetical protein
MKYRKDSKMRKFTYRFLIWTLVLVFVAVLIGCEEQQTMSPKKAKLVAANNIQLKKDIAARDTDIEKQKKLLTDCEKEKEILNKRLNTKSEGLMEVLMAGMDKDAKNIRIENQELKKQIQELKNKLAEK